MAFSSQRILPAREWEEAAAAGWWARWRALGCCSLLSGSWRQYTGTLMGRYHLYSSDHRNRNKQMCCFSLRFRKCRTFSTFTFMSSLLLNLFFQMLIVIRRPLLWFASLFTSFIWLASQFTTLLWLARLFTSLLWLVIKLNAFTFISLVHICGCFMYCMKD